MNSVANNIPAVPNFELIAQSLEQSPDFVVLRRFQPVDQYCEDDGSRKKTLMILDTETTGLDYKKDVVFEIGYVLVEYSPDTGKLYKIIDRYSGFEDPGFPLPEVIVKLTGVTDDEVRGQTFDWDKINEDIKKTDLVLAHNASFDRKFVEPIFPLFIKKPFACSLTEGPWEEMGIKTKKLEYLAMTISHVFYDAHRALTDAEVTLHVLAQNAHDDKNIFSHVLASARVPSYRVWATNAPFEKKDALKIDGKFYWSDGTEEGKLKAWFKDRVTDIDVVLDFLATNVYAREQKIDVDRIEPMDRHSVRYTERVQMVTQKLASIVTPMMLDQSSIERITQSISNDSFAAPLLAQKNVTASSEAVSIPDVKIAIGTVLVESSENPAPKKTGFAAFRK
jgi:DNA polymerase-3 subunit epsilon